MTDPIIEERIKLLAPDYVELLRGDFVSEIAQTLGNEAGLDEDKTNVLGNAIYLYLMLFLNLEEFQSFISEECELSNNLATDLANKVLTNLPDDFTKNHEEAIKIFSTNELEEEIKETQKSLESIPKIRTMANDMTTSGHIIEDEVVHSSTQASLIKESARDTGSSEGKWETE